MTCPVLRDGAIELFFYNELPPPGRADVEAHLRGCRECRQSLEDLMIIRAALSARPGVSTPPGGWGPFMARLDQAVALADDEERAHPAVAVPTTSWRFHSGYLAAAAVLTLVTVSVLYAPKGGRPDAGSTGPPVVAGTVSPGPERTGASPAASHSPETDGADPALFALSGQHFERSKLVLLGLAAREPLDTAGRDWAYERELAGTLLGDTRVYRQAAEARGMGALADVMRDLELVLLQTSMSHDPDAETLGQLQRLIRRRDLLTKMDVVHAAGP